MSERGGGADVGAAHTRGVQCAAANERHCATRLLRLSLTVLSQQCAGTAGARSDPPARSPTWWL